MLLLAFLACKDGPAPDSDSQPAGTDRDLDGVALPEDCNDYDASIHPGAVEACNGIDDDCDGAADESLSGTWYEDNDGDRWGNPEISETACDGRTGYVDDGSDCDDGQPAVHPGALELCDGVDQDCDGSTDEDPVDGEVHPDADSDGFGDPDVSLAACAPPAGYTFDDTDCDDTDAHAFPGNPEICDEADNDCDGEVDDGVTTTWYADVDEDGVGDSALTAEACDTPKGYVAEGGDCDDADPLVTEGNSWYLDYDGDGHGGNRISAAACTAPSGYLASSDDCDDGDPANFPGATETCDGDDDDCDGLADDDDPGLSGGSTWYADADGDGSGGSSSVFACTAPSGHVATTGDCDDTDAAVRPGGSELCNGGVDDDCDGLADDADSSPYGTSTFFADSDGDGYGDPSSTADLCAATSAWVEDDTDCDDGDAAVNPAATETCNGADDDCDGFTDDDDPDGTGSTSTYYRDADGDGYGTSSTTVTACSAPSGYVASSTDCNDASGSVNPAASETCNATDDDCDGTIDSSAACGCTVATYGSHAYAFCNSATDWNSAKSWCTSRGYNLASVNDSSENSWLTSATTSYLPSYDPWIGFNDVSSEGSWVWQSGDSVSYTNWSSGEPNNSGNEDCAHLYDSGKWNDHQCSGLSTAWICESK